MQQKKRRPFGRQKGYYDAFCCPAISDVQSFRAVIDALERSIACAAELPSGIAE